MDPVEIKIKPFCLSLMIICLIEAGGSFFLRHTSFPIILVLGILRFFEIIFFLMIFSIWGNGMSDLGLGRSQIIPGIRQGGIWALGFGLLVILSAGLIFLLGMNPFKLIHTRMPQRFSELMVFLLVAGIIGPVAEELFFRGIPPFSQQTGPR